MSQLTTHVLDTSNGEPAAGVRITLQFIEHNGQWEDLACKKTDSEGRISNLLSKNKQMQPGVYRLIFETGTYFNDLGIKSFYPYVPVVFEVVDDSHYHVPLLVNPYGYSTYRGS